MEFMRAEKALELSKESHKKHLRDQLEDLKKSVNIEIDLMISKGATFLEIPVSGYDFSVVQEVVENLRNYGWKHCLVEFRQTESSKVTSKYLLRVSSN